MSYFINATTWDSSSSNTMLPWNQPAGPIPSSGVFTFRAEPTPSVGEPPPFEEDDTDMGWLNRRVDEIAELIAA